MTNLRDSNPVQPEDSKLLKSLSHPGVMNKRLGTRYCRPPWLPPPFRRIPWKHEVCTCSMGVNLPYLVILYALLRL